MTLKFGEYDKNILKLFSGTAIAQLISFLLVPIIAKQYGPSEYGIYAATVAVISILSVFSTGKYELAIILPESQSEAKKLVSLSYSINFLFCFILLLSIVILPLEFLNKALNIKAKNKFIYLIIPVATYLLGAFQVLNYWMVREKKFKILSINKVLRTLIFAVAAIIVGFYWPSSIYLTSALVLSHFISNVFLRSRQDDLSINVFYLLHNKYFSEVLVIIKKYIQFPSYILPAEFINVLCAQMPIFIFLWYFSPVDSGYFSFILTLLNIPITLLSGSILDVFKERATTDYRNTGSCRIIYKDTLLKMVLLSVIPFSLLYWIGGDLIGVFFGEKWIGAVRFLEIMLVMFFFKFISSPLSFVFYIAGRQKEDFLWHIYILFSSFLALYLGAFVYHNTILTLQLYSINFSIIYIIYLIRSYQLSQSHNFR